MTDRRVLLINDFASSGGAEEIYQLSARMLRQQSFAVATIDRADVPAAPLANNKAWNMAASRTLLARIDEWRPDYVWLHNFHGFFSLAVFRTLRRLKQAYGFGTFMTLHDYQAIGFNPTLLTYDRRGRPTPLPENKIGRVGALRYRATPKGLLVDVLRKGYWLAGRRLAPIDRAIDVFLCPSPFMQRVAAKAGLQNTRYLPQPCFVPATTPADRRSLPGSGLRLAYLGRLGPEKGLDQFIGLLIETGFAGVDYLTVIGDGPERSRIETIVRTGNASKRVRWTGRLKRDHAFDVLAAHDALVLPSIWYENAPMVVVEAAALGMPVFVPRRGSLVDFGDSLGNKIFFEFSAAGIQEGLQALSSHLEQNRCGYSLAEFSLARYSCELRNLFS